MRRDGTHEQAGRVVLTILDEPYPCETCALWDHCQRHHMACRAFMDYASGRQWTMQRRPNHRYFTEIFKMQYET